MPREAPPQNTIYTGMLAVSLGAIVVGCIVLAMHLNAYEWTMEVKGGPAVSLPQKTSPVAPSGDGQGAALPARPHTPAVASTTPSDARPAPTVPPPGTLPANPVDVATRLPQTPAPQPAEATQPVSAPQTKPTGIVPSTFRPFGGR